MGGLRAPSRYLSAWWNRSCGPLLVAVSSVSDEQSDLPVVRPHPAVAFRLVAHAVLSLRVAEVNVGPMPDGVAGPGEGACGRYADHGGAGDEGKAQKRSGQWHADGCPDGFRWSRSVRRAWLLLRKGSGRQRRGPSSYMWHGASACRLCARIPTESDRARDVAAGARVPVA